ncbi:hypothetical protein IJG72_07150 [bacterium]|nr:hypothetical protein [bacterium]
MIQGINKIMFAKNPDINYICKDKNIDKINYNNLSKNDNKTLNYSNCPINDVFEKTKNIENDNISNNKDITFGGLRRNNNKKYYKIIEQNVDRITQGEINKQIKSEIKIILSHGKISAKDYSDASAGIKFNMKYGIPNYFGLIKDCSNLKKEISDLKEKALFECAEVKSGIDCKKHFEKACKDYESARELVLKIRATYSKNWNDGNSVTDKEIQKIELSNIAKCHEAEARIQLYGCGVK